MQLLKKKLSENLARVRDDISAACARAGRDSSAVTLVAITKSVELQVMRALLELGQVDLGENRPQQLAERAAIIQQLREQAGSGDSAGQEKTGSSPAPRWHMVGHLQRNKVALVLTCSRIIHSVDNLRLAEDLNSKSGRQGIVVEVLMEVNCSGESSKQGVAPAAINHLAEQFNTLKHIRLVGLMTMGPLVSKAEQARPAFVRLRELFEEMHREGCVNKQCQHLSMGTSQDYQVAIEEGATMVRLGRALFDSL